MSPPTQANRQIAISTPLGTDVLLLTAFSWREQISRPFALEAELASTDPEIRFDDVVGRSVGIRLDLAHDRRRYFHGYVSRLVQVGNQGRLARYHATIVPWLWFLTRTSDCRIFQDKSVPDIIEEVFRDRGFSDYELRLSGTYANREYCVQYRETDFNFVCRLMEQVGIYFWFIHEEERHILILADAISASEAAPGYETVDFTALERGVSGREVIFDWTLEQEVQPVGYALDDFDFKKPHNELRATTAVERQHGEARFEIFDYPGEYLVPDEGERLARIRLEELQAQRELVRGQASARGLAVGSLFKLEGHPRPDQAREYLLTSITLQADAGDFEAHEGGGADFFSCRFAAIPKEQNFRAPRTTPKPLVQGPQTAIVTGPAGEEIHTDEHARVKVQFHWDRYGQQDENSSCWVRVSHANAGKGWGSMITPRIGQEVIVEFLEGDPDRPIITGRVYNGVQIPPYADGQGVVSGLKSNTHKGGGNNAMSMDDTAGKEKLTIHAQHDMNSTVGNDQTLNVTNNRTDTIGVNDSETVGGTQTVKVTGHRKLTVDGGQDVTITGAHDVKVTGHQKTDIGGGQELKVTGDDATDVTAHQAVTIGSGQDVTVTGVQKLESSGKQTLKAGGGQDLDVTGKQMVHATGDIEITSDAKIKLSAGGSTIEIGPSGITIEAAAKVTVKGTTIALN